LPNCPSITRPLRARSSSSARRRTRSSPNLSAALTRAPAAAIANVGASVAEVLDQLSNFSPAELRQQWRERHMAIGRIEVGASPGA
jgi:hypothetical protein